MNKKTVILVIFLIATAGMLAIIFSWNPFKRFAKDYPNLVVITVDTTRADRLGCYGYDGVYTPNIDALAEEGVLFEEAFSVQPVTLPSHSSIFTGLYPYHHGVRDNNIYKLSDKNLTLAEVLRERGYLTTAFLASYILSGRFGLSQGFQYYNDSFVKPKQKGRLPVDRRASEVSFLAGEWFDVVKDELKEKPFFLWLHYYDPHADYDPPHPYKGAYANKYDGEIAYMDDWIGYFFDQLKKRGMWDNTIVVLAGDHGESHGEYGENTHGIFMYRATTHVPMIIRYPEALPGGARIKERVSIVDIMPTILDLLNIKVKEKMDGRSLVPVVEKKKTEPERPIYSEAFIPKSFNWSELKGIRQGGWLFIEAPKPELYQVGQDGKAVENVIEKNKDISDMLRTRLMVMLSDADETKVEHVAVDDEMVEKLQALGYFVGGGETSDDDKTGGARPDPKDRIALFKMYQRANSLLSKEIYHLGIPLFEKIIKEDPENTRFLMELGDAYIKTDKFEDAEKILNQTLTINSLDARSHYMLGLCYEKWNKPELAIKAFKEATAINPRHYLAHFHLGMVHINLRQWEKATDAFNANIQIRPKDPAVLNNMGYIAIKGANNYKQGISLIQQALKLAPKDHLILGSLGSAYINSGNYQNGIKFLEKALSIVPDDTRFIKELKQAYILSGENEKLRQLKEREKLLQ